MKLLTMPFKVRVIVAVDFRAAMGSPHHPRGHCPARGCQLGLHGIQVRPILLVIEKLSVYRFTDRPPQQTMTTLEPEKATQGELISFLDLVEKDARDVAASISRRSARHGPGPSGEAYYLGIYTPTLTQSLVYSLAYTALQDLPCHRR